MQGGGGGGDADFESSFELWFKGKGGGNALRQCRKFAGSGCCVFGCGGRVACAGDAESSCRGAMWFYTKQTETR